MKDIDIKNYLIYSLLAFLPTLLVFLFTDFRYHFYSIPIPVKILTIIWLPLAAAWGVYVYKLKRHLKNNKKEISLFSTAYAFWLIPAMVIYTINAWIKVPGILKGYDFMFFTWNLLLPLILWCLFFFVIAFCLLVFTNLTYRTIASLLNREKDEINV